MSSPGRSGLPPDPPHESTPPPEPTSSGQVPGQGGPSVTADAPPEMPPPDDGEESGDPAPPGPNGGGSNARRPLSSFTFVSPVPMNRPEGGEEQPDDGNRLVLTWTIEVFPNDGSEGMNGEAPTDAPGVDGDALPQADADAGHGVHGPPGAALPTGGDGSTGDGEAHQAGGTDADRNTGTIFLVLGPDGRVIPRPGGDDGGQPPPFFFPFGLPFTFQPPPPAPDPAKAAELLASLPTVGRALLKRVNMVVAAEDAAGGKEYDDRGWRCGICLEGLEEEAERDEPEQAVKALPCNHLFHEGCLQPWFTTHHTCPTCRLDLDPLRTLHGPRETRANPLRPAPTGSGRTTPASAAHPYARGDRSRARSGVQTPLNPDAQAQAPPADTPVPVPTPLNAPTPQSILESLVSQVTQAAFGQAMRQNQLFDNHLTASPAPMGPPEPPRTADTPGSPSPAAGPSRSATVENQTQANPSPATAGASSEARPTPERRPHIHFIRVPSPMNGGHGPAPPPRENATTPGTASATPAPNATANPPNAEDAGRRMMNFPLEFFFLRPQPHGVPMAPPPAPPAPETPAVPERTFVPQTLQAWTEQREKTLGWRCDAVECLVAHPIPESGAEDMDLDDSVDSDLTVPDKDMLSIYAPTQAAFPAVAEGEEAHAGANYVILACDHRWHRTCLETAERSAGHKAGADVDGREWVRCPRCRKEGWITPRSETPVNVAPTVAVEA